MESRPERFSRPDHPQRGVVRVALPRARYPACRELCPWHTHAHDIPCAWVTHAHVRVANARARILYTKLPPEHHPVGNIIINIMSEYKILKKFDVEANLDSLLSPHSPQKYQERYINHHLCKTLNPIFCRLFILK